MLDSFPHVIRVAIGVTVGVVVTGVACIVILSKLASRSDGREGFAALMGPSYNVVDVRAKRLSRALEVQRKQADRAKARIRRTSSAIAKASEKYKDLMMSKLQYKSLLYNGLQSGSESELQTNIPVASRVRFADESDHDEDTSGDDYDENDNDNDDDDSDEDDVYSEFDEDESRADTNYANVALQDAPDDKIREEYAPVHAPASLSRTPDEMVMVNIHRAEAIYGQAAWHGNSGVQSRAGGNVEDAAVLPIQQVFELSAREALNLRQEAVDALLQPKIATPGNTSRVGTNGSVRGRHGHHARNLVA